WAIMCATSQCKVSWCDCRSARCHGVACRSARCHGVACCSARCPSLAYHVCSVTVHGAIV
ncbi:hypothetical protein NDU88_012048, partial [Pleurodeles waltl]